MEPVTSFLVGHVASKCIDTITETFRTQVVERWSKRRARQFFESFCEQVQLELEGARSLTLDTILDQLLEDESGSELLFESYRRVTLSRSTSIGPRIIGILSARLALANREATSDEEQLLEACERLNDSELLQFSKFITGERRAREASANSHEHEELRIEFGKESIDSSWHSETNISLSPLDLHDSLGSWAVKLRDVGLLSDDMQERTWAYSQDSERHIDEPGTVREITWWVVVSKPCFHLADLIERASVKRTNS